MTKLLFRNEEPCKEGFFIWPVIVRQSSKTESCRRHVENQMGSKRTLEGGWAESHEKTMALLL